MKTEHLKRVLSLFLLFCFLVSACNILNIPTTQIPTQTNETNTPVKDTPTVEATLDLSVYPAAFADYPVNAVSLPESYPVDYSLPLDINQYQNLADFALTASQKAALSQNGFVVVPPSSDPNSIFNEFYQAYESIRYDQTPIFVTTDSVFHVYHLLFDKILRDLERQDFIPALKDLTTALVNESKAQLESLKGTALEAQAKRNLAYFLVAASLLKTGDKVPAEVEALVTAELKLINAHAEAQVSPIWDREDLAPDARLIEDYTQYIPRGHYTRSEELQNYFKAMMWYGRLTFRLNDTFETQRALLMVQAMRNAKTASSNSVMDLWERIYDPTVFIVGKADDLSIYEYEKLSQQIFGAAPELTSFADVNLMNRFLKAAEQLPPPQINSMWVWIWQDREQVTKGFRFMGQRFTLDEYVFGQVMWRKVGTLEKPRDLPKALDFFAAMGSSEAYTLLDQMGETQYLNYTAQMEKVKTQVASLEKDSWTQNLYWSWLYALQPLISEKGKQFPAFMQTKAWTDKSLQTALGSWTELKHDTILYAKQVMAEMGGGGPDQPPHGYVEPDPEAYARLLSLAEMTRDGLAKRNLLVLDNTSMNNLANLIDELAMLKTVAEAELNGQPLSEEQYWSIQYYGGWLEAMTIAAADTEGESGARGYLEDQKSALVADVATGIGRVLEEGSGYPTLIYVALPGSEKVIGVGAVYTYYEFEVKPADRMTDQTWQQHLESGNAPKMPDWTSSFIVP